MRVRFHSAAHAQRCSIVHHGHERTGKVCGKVFTFAEEIVIRTLTFSLLLVLGVGNSRPTSRQKPAVIHDTVFVHDTVGTPKPATAKHEPASDEAQHLKYERRIANGTVALAVATLILVAVTGGLAGYTARLWGATQTLAKDTKDAGTQQHETMLGQLEAMVTQSATASATLDQFRREFAVANRPKVRLRRIHFEKELPPARRVPDRMGGYVEEPPDNAVSPNVRIEMANVGGVGVARAILRVTFIPFNSNQPIPWKIQEELAKAIAKPIDIPHGGSGVLVVTVPEVKALFYDSGVLTGSQWVYCIGYVEYEDETRTLRGRTGFIRYYDRMNGWFLPDRSPGGADFEYAD